MYGSVIVIQNRLWYYPQTTVGKIEITKEGKTIYDCYCLEDTVRGVGIKVPKFTAIPEYIYKVSYRYSPTFKRDMLMLYTEEDMCTIIAHGITFKYVYSHGGNKHEDTDGCIIVGKNRDENEIYNSAERDIFDIVYPELKDNRKVIWRVINNPTK